MNTKNYLIDLLVYDESGENYYSPLEYNGKEGEQYSTTTGYNDLQTITIEQLESLHKINYAGWISEGTRWASYLLFADCSGNNKHKHYFSYFGTPETYKVVIVFNDGETRITDVIHKTDFQSKISIDVNTMKVVTQGNVTSNLKSISVVLFFFKEICVNSLNSPSLFAINSIIAGSISPDLVPMIKPSRGVNPMDVSTHFPPETADTEAPFPK